MQVELIKQLRELTQAGMKDCKDALAEAGGDLQKAVDLIKIKGKNIASNATGKVAAEGKIAIGGQGTNFRTMLECNAQTDFTANTLAFHNLVEMAALNLGIDFVNGESFNLANVEEQRQKLISTTKENIVIRRWWVEQATSPNAKVFTYLHSNAKIGVLLTLLGSSIDSVNSTEFNQLGEDLAMQVAAMNPIAVSPDRISAEDMDRQKAIFEGQLKELKKPEQAWPKIMEGKFGKWFSEVTLLNQESIVSPKTSVKQVIDNVSKTIGEVNVVSFIRCEVGQGIEKKTSNLADEVAKLM